MRNCPVSDVSSLCPLNAAEFLLRCFRRLARFGGTDPAWPRKAFGVTPSAAGRAGEGRRARGERVPAGVAWCPSVDAAELRPGDAGAPTPLPCERKRAFPDIFLTLRWHVPVAGAVASSRDVRLALTLLEGWAFSFLGELLFQNRKLVLLGSRHLRGAWTAAVFWAPENFTVQNPLSRLPACWLAFYKTPWWGEMNLLSFPGGQLPVNSSSISAWCLRAHADASVESERRK